MCSKWDGQRQRSSLSENIRHEQRKVIKYKHLVADMIILYNVVSLPSGC